MLLPFPISSKLMKTNLSLFAFVTIRHTVNTWSINKKCAKLNYLHWMGRKVQSCYDKEEWQFTKCFISCLVSASFWQVPFSPFSWACFKQPMRWTTAVCAGIPMHAKNKSFILKVGRRITMSERLAKRHMVIPCQPAKVKTVCVYSSKHTHSLGNSFLQQNPWVSHREAVFCS